MILLLLILLFINTLVLLLLSWLCFHYSGQLIKHIELQLFKSESRKRKIEIEIPGKLYFGNVLSSVLLKSFSWKTYHFLHYVCILIPSEQNWDNGNKTRIKKNYILSFIRIALQKVKEPFPARGWELLYLLYPNIHL